MSQRRTLKPTLEEPALEQLRLGNPATRALPLLRCLARREYRRVVLPMDGTRQPGRGAAPAMNAVLGREQLRELIPHAGDMCLLERVIASSKQRHRVRGAVASHSPNIRCATTGSSSALHLAEYAAQAMAVHGALISRGGARPGLLAALA